MSAWWQTNFERPWRVVPETGGGVGERLSGGQATDVDVDLAGNATVSAEFEALSISAEKLDLDTALEALLEHEPVRNLIAQIFADSPYLRSLIQRDPARFFRLLRDGPEACFSQAVTTLHETLADHPPLSGAMTALRLFKSDAALLIGLADLSGLWPLTHVTGALTDVADIAVSSAVAFLFRQSLERGDWIADAAASDDLVSDSGLFVLGMGKYGAGELNYSSDIDLIVFFDAAKARVKDGLAPQQFYVRLVRNLMKLINEQSPDGYVFRVDLRLRPDPGSTQVAMSTDAALVYYENYGQNWERAAFIKARPVAGDFSSAHALLRELDAYVWRKYLDYAAVADVHAMKRQIHAFKGFGDIAIRGHDVKLGRGGIREIEFFVQTQQLIAGGRQPDLREPRTMVALERLCERGWITDTARDELTDAYVFLRTIEHRLQMVNDAQTHVIPSDDAAIVGVARLAGFPDLETFSSAARRQLERVQAHYAALFEDVAELTGAGGNLVFAGEANDPETLETLSQIGFSQPGVVLDTMRGWHHGRYRATMSERARESLTEFQPVLVEALAKTSDPDQAFLAFDRFLSDLPAGIQLFSLLRNNPNLLRLVADVMGTAPRLAQSLSRRSRTLEAILDPGFFGQLPEAGELDGLISESLSSAVDFGDVLDRARVIGHEQSFLVGVRVLSGSLTWVQAGLAYTRLADSLIAQMLHAVQAELVRNHGSMPGGEAVVVGMGKLGGFEMTASSDLDLILIYDWDDSSSSSDGARPLMAGQYFSRMTQRLVTSLSSPTAEGRLYEVDMRLRPSGNSGPVATRLSSFEEYQTRDAWTWEHMALLRARCIAGPRALCTEVERVRKATLSMKRVRSTTVADIRDMRDRLERERGTVNPWDLKLVRGGMVDVEFIIQFLQLLHGADHPDVLERNSGEALAALVAKDLVHPDHAAILLQAIELLSALTQVLRLCLDDSFDRDTAPDGLKTLLAQAVGEPEFERVDARLNDVLSRVKSAFDEIIC